MPKQIPIKKRSTFDFARQVRFTCISFIKLPFGALIVELIFEDR